MDAWRLGRAILRGALTGRSPIYVQYALTHRCNLNCRMCNSNRSRSGETELSLAEIEQLAAVLADLRVAVLVITGGEPMIRRDLPDVIRTFVRHGITPRLQTNGLLATADSVRQLLDAGLREVTLSLDSLDPERQDYINGRAGSWHRTIEALAVFGEFLPPRGNASAINVVVSKLNLAEVLDVVRFATRIGFLASLIPVHLAPPGASHFIIRKDAPEFAFTPADHPAIDATYATLVAMKRRGFAIQNSTRFLRDCPAFLKQGMTRWTCESPDLYFAISPSGAFFPCVDIPGEVSMLWHDFVRTFRSTAFRREIRSQVERCPGCFYACWPEVSFLCHDPGALMERAAQLVRLALCPRPRLTADEMVHLAQQIRSEGGSR
ncbi:MAG: radical SAM protein [Planctomycetes bacterium]|nr:radical SAM protein [Planctomycetota bacterium]